MLPSTLLTGSASAVLWLSRLNSTPHTIAVYASYPPLPATTQHSLPGARYGLPGPVSHRQDNASFPGAQAIHRATGEKMDCFVALLLAMTASALPPQPRPAINPREIAVPLLLRFRAHDGVAEVGVLAGGMIDVLADRA
jgi:hypothetical protein